MVAQDPPSLSDRIRNVVLWLSASGLKGHAQCPLQVMRTPRGLDNPAFARGRLTHRIMRWWLSGADLNTAREFALRDEGQDNPDPNAMKDCASVVSWFRRPQNIITIEGEDPPYESGFRTVGYDNRPLFRVPVDWWGLRGSFDLAYHEPGPGGGWIRVVDWKGRSEEDTEIQAMVYAYAALEMYAWKFPGAGVRVSFYGIPSGLWEPHHYEWTPEYIRGDIRENLHQRAIDYRRDLTNPTPEARPNKFCSYCVLKTVCPAVNSKDLMAPQTPLTPDPLAAAPTSTLLDVYDHLKERQKTLGVAVAMVEEELKSKGRLDEPVHHAGYERVLMERTSGYNTDVPGMLSLATDLGIKTGEFYKVDVTKLSNQVRDKAKEKGGDWLDKYRALRSPRSTAVVISRRKLARKLKAKVDPE